ncbi:hypothetical protein [Streptomyces indicus]|uniref:Uncharacterized protein n=1 Tax=Streptomyces indicus TaxID=417292 RepID=A0A1G9IVH8_9ACTN|nr:hypothetical protein [Streptomyces indicus]SDL29121.1 hypothetical protein SAMN05421806_12589 [Streptomyces indicus]
MEHPVTPTPLLTKAELKKWLKVSDFWVRDRLENDATFVERCVVDIAPEGSSRRTIRYHYGRTAEYLGIDQPAKSAA